VKRILLFLILPLAAAAASLNPADYSTNCPDTNFFELTWTPSPDTNVTGYVALYGTASNNFTRSQSLGNGTNGILFTTNMEPLYVAVVAFDRAGSVSDPSNIIPLITPGVPRTNILISWGANLANVVVQASPDLVNWPFATNVTGSNIVLSIDPRRSCFFRATDSLGNPLTINFVCPWVQP